MENIDFPTRVQVREASYEEMASKAAMAFDAGRVDVALAWVGFDGWELKYVCGGRVWLHTWRAPTGGNSPRDVKLTAELNGSPAKYAFAPHILRHGVAT